MSEAKIMALTETRIAPGAVEKEPLRQRRVSRIAPWAFLACFAGFSAAAVAQNPALTQRAMWGRIVVSGSLQDQYGRPVTGAKMRITENLVTPESFGVVGKERSEEVPDGWFRVECELCSTLHLFLYKEGYYSATLEVPYVTDLESPPARSAEPPVVEKLGVVIVLEEGVQPVRLQRFRTVLESGPEVEDIVMVLAPGEPMTQEVRRVEEKAAVAGGSPPFLVLRPALDSAGLVALETEKSSDKASIRYDAPAPAVLDLSAAAGGIVLYEPSTRYVQMALREMKLAPESGYESQIVLESGKQDLYFYCLIDGKYGKGRVTAPRIEHRKGGRRSVAAGIEIHLNPDGSRNLEALD